MRAVRCAAYVALTLAYLQVVFGAVVRITGSGLGCGDDWPRCEGRLIPPLERPDLVIEVTHRYLALAVSLAVAALLAIVLYRRAKFSAAERRVVRPAVLAAVLVISAALLGGLTVKLDLHTWAVVAHMVVAGALLGALVTTLVRSGGLGASPRGPAPSRRAVAAATTAAAVVLAALALGAATANYPGASGSCGGFPHCRRVMTGGDPLMIHLGHRVVAIVAAMHVLAAAFFAQRRGEPAIIRRVAWITAAVIGVQIVIAAAMVETGLSPAIRGVHQAVGMLAWIAAMTWAGLARETARIHQSPGGPAA